MDFLGHALGWVNQVSWLGGISFLPLRDSHLDPAAIHSTALCTDHSEGRAKASKGKDFEVLGF